MKTYIIIAAVGITLVAVLEFLSKNTLNKKRGYIYSLGVVLLAFITQVANCRLAVSQDKENVAFSNTIKASNVQIVKIKQTLDSTTKKLLETGVMLSEIKYAIENSKLRYDSIKKEIIPVVVKSELYMPNPNIKGGNNQFGNNNTQNN